MTNEPLLAPLLRQLGACDDGPDDAVAWAGRWRVSRAAYHACERGDWLLWLAARVGLDRKLVVAAACDCAELALRHVPDDEERPRRAIDTARAWCCGEATVEQVRGAQAAAWAAAGATEAAAWAAWAAWGAAWAAWGADEAADEAAWAAARAAWGAAEAARSARAAAWAAELERCATLVRQRIPFEVMRDALLKAEVPDG